MATNTVNHQNLRREFDSDISAIGSLDDLAAINSKYLGKNGLINSCFKSLTKEEKKINGTFLNQLKNEIGTKITEKSQYLTQHSKSDTIDITIPGIEPPSGHIHLISRAIKDIENIFFGLGFIRRRYREVETDWYAAEGLNIPRDHPARDDQETFYLDTDVVLTAHTSNGQLREMEMNQSMPIKMINIGKTYRRQIDISHTPMFHQFEGLLIDKAINITHLVGVSNYFVKNYFGTTRKIRLRPHHFQFTEPSFEIDITCSTCSGAGCRLCKAGWLELGGAGMVHPQVLINGGLDPKTYSGFAFGWGVERVLMMKYGLSDIRDIYSTDLRILNQF